jgi:DUF1680 family protein
MRTFLLAFVATLLLSNFATAVELFDYSQVRITDGPLRHAAELNRNQLLLYDPDRLLAPMLNEAGLEPKAKPYPSWETSGLNGQTAGHYLTALAITAAALDDAKCRERLDYMVAELARAQAANGNGYVGGVPGSRDYWPKIATGSYDVQGFSLDGRWVPWYNLHKTFAGLRDAYLITGNQQAREVLVGLADWTAELIGKLNDEQLQRMLGCEQGGMNEVLADVASITGDDKYLALAKRFSHRAILDPLVRGEDRLTGLHANTQVPKVVGFERIAQLSDDPDFHRAAVTFWDKVVDGRTLAFGGNSVHEHFPGPDQSMAWIDGRGGPETCNTYNMLRLTEQLFAVDPTTRYADFYERAMMNHILSSQHPEHGGYVYYTPARPRHYRVYSDVEENFWCCVGSGMESQSKYGRFIYAHDGDTALYVNLFVPSKLDWKDKGLVVTQQTTFPNEPKTSLQLNTDSPTKLAIRIRYPSWVAEGKLAVDVNGEPVEITNKPGRYVEIDRTWNDGDTIDVSLPMHTTIESLPYQDDYVALVHGPIVLAARTGTENLEGLVATAERDNQSASGPMQSLNEAPMLVATRDELPAMLEPVAGKPMTFTLAGAIRPDTFDQLELVPFAGVHDARYMVYWRLVSPGEYQQELARIEAAEQAALALDRATVDRVPPGEQQPETEHNFQGERTETGVWNDRRYRHAQGWWSYDLATDGQDDLELALTYWGDDHRHFDIHAGEELIAKVDFEGPTPGEFVTHRYKIPAEVLASAKDGKLTIKFTAHEGSMAGGIYDVRLVKKGEE